MKMVKSKSVVPIYLIGLLWLLYAFLFPLYRLIDYFMVSILSVLLYFLTTMVIPTLFPRKGYESINTSDPYTDEMLITAIDNLEKLRLIRNAIGNEKVRKQIEGLDSDTHRIIEFIKKYPDKCSKVSQFFLYYLPTTVKLINNYKELEMQGQVGENHSKGIEKMEGFMNELVIAYRKILDDLSEDKVMEASIDIDVMEKMLQQDEYLKE